MPEVDIIINNREHKIACSPGEENRVAIGATIISPRKVSLLALYLDDTGSGIRQHQPAVWRGDSLLHRDHEQTRQFLM